MRRSVAIGASVAVAAVFTHGTVLAGVSLNEPAGSTYEGFFRQVALATERLWSYANGWEPMSHVRDFGQFYAPAVELICPLLGFGVFWIISRHKVGLKFWKPVAIVTLLAIPRGYLAVVPWTALPIVEVARTLFIVALMMWSVGAIRLRSFLRDPIRQPAPALR